MRSLLHITILAFGLVITPGLLTLQGHGQPVLELPQGRNKEWTRMSTAQDSTTDVQTASLILEPNGVFRATFRIQLSKAEKAPEKADATYKTRLMTLQFDSRKRTYRVFETTLLDSSKKVVYTSGQLVDAPWKPGVGGSFYEAASNLSPFGSWSVVSSTSSEKVTDVTIRLDRFQVGRRTCSLPSYEPTSMSRAEVAKVTGLQAADIQVSAENVSVVKIKCDSLNLSSEIHILIPKSLDRAILLSGGELYSLAK